MKYAIEQLRDASDEEEDVTKAKNLLKKLGRVMWGQEKIKIIIEDPNGNSAIISDKAVKEPMKPNRGNPSPDPDEPLRLGEKKQKESDEA